MLSDLRELEVAVSRCRALAPDIPESVRLLGIDWLGSYVGYLGREITPAPSKDQCVGLDVPQFLGGAFSLDNLRLIDLDVYWDISAQLARQVAELPEGTPISRIDIR